jgi:RNA polymerase sigma-70 factor (sigma-E family)
MTVESPTPVAPIAEGGAWYEANGMDDYVRGHANRLFRVAFLLTGDRHRAEDLVQTVLARVAPRWERIAAVGDPFPYLRVALARTAIGWRRRRWLAEVPTAELPDVTTSPDALTQIDMRMQLADALRELTSRQRAVVVLRYYGDLSEADTAAALGCSVGSVKTHSSRALTHLQRALTPPSFQEEANP